MLLYRQIMKKIGDYMQSTELDRLKAEIDALREQIHTYMEYPEIFKSELLESSNKIDALINEYMSLTSK